MRIGVVSDTHGHVANTLAAVAQLTELQVDLVLHCGDIGSVQVVPFFEGWPSHFVLGNADDHEAGYRWVIEDQGAVFHGRIGRLELDGGKIAIIHGDDHRALQAAIASGQFDLVCTGHTHRRELRREGRTLVLNPGALYRANPKSFAVVEWPELDVTFVDLRETGP
jgi:putative phosphoesterase